MTDNEIFAATTTELQDGQMKEVQAGETKILLAKVDGKYYAVGAVCPHYKAPLVKGALCGTRLYCPWHHSAFDITNGNVCEPPAIDGLPRYKTRIENDQIFVQITEEKTEDINTNLSVTDSRTFIMLGGGAAGLMAVQTLRSEGFNGKLIMITKEDTLPYDRTALSKKFMTGKAKPEELLLRKEDFFEKHKIEIEKNKEVKHVDADSKRIRFFDGSSIQYDTMMIATGGEPNKLTIAGAGLKNVFTLRSAEDAERILETAKNVKKVCIIGASFIGMETAASLQTLGLEVTVIAKESTPFEKNFGVEIGDVFYNMHKEKGVVIKTNAEVEKIEGKNTVEAIVLKNSERIETELVIAGIGVHPRTDFITGVKLNEKDKSVLVDEYLQAAYNLFAAGDIARFPDAKTNQNMRIEHWRLAQQHGRIAAMNMLGKTSSVHDIVPFFWTNQFEKRLSYVGHAEDWDEIVIDGDIQNQKFIAFYVKEGKVLAAASMNRDVESDKIEELMRTQKLMSVDEIKEKL